MSQDKEASRGPLPAARVLDNKLANWSGGRRYTCPSYEITRLADGVTIAVPGFQPFSVYDVLLANLIPGTERREPAETCARCWIGPAPRWPRARWRCCSTPTMPMRVSELGRVADERHVGADGFWTLAPDPARSERQREELDRRRWQPRSPHGACAT